ncbi:DUF4864 domain-containing protein [Noviherbaspirillum galbum]|uniref:DUF4864 domain-containing protein n=1 Tax=Noviherbaspirillum galbum TaxID=2709383 RepID=A0A6B3SSC6_9BURK|nr:DUF4864 domain-containing protein [Noviherbaspirillum galbum]NEX60499.1 DUF4864 domain-containing protein [Noviherbaspirillum galbum]
MKRLLVMAGLLSALAAPLCRAMDAITTADAIAIHEVVESQLEAFANDDANSAFELATPEKRMILGSADRFLRLIKEQYNPIYRYRNTIFMRPEVIEGEPIQIVRVTDSEGKVWVAVFWMQQEDDSSWKVDGCQLFETSSIST